MSDSILTNVVGFAAFGFGVRTFQLGIQKRPIFSTPWTHIAYSAAFGAFGYWYYFVEQNSRKLLEERRGQLIESRQKAAAASA